jgi:hypothetical protein
MPRRRATEDSVAFGGAVVLGALDHWRWSCSYSLDMRERGPSWLTVGASHLQAVGPSRGRRFFFVAHVVELAGDACSTGDG